MFGSWFAKGILAFLLTFAMAGLARAQNKSADLPITQKLDCAPAITIPEALPANFPAAFYRSSLQLMPEPKGEPLDLTQVLSMSSWKPGSDPSLSQVLYSLDLLPMLFTNPLGFAWQLVR